MIIPIVADLYHGNSVNFTQVKAAGLIGIIHKARQGIGYGDPAYTSRMAAWKGLSGLWGAYDFSTGDNVAVNVADFLTFAKLASRDLAALDFEDNSQSEMSADQAHEFLDRVNQARGTACVIYGGNRIREQIDPQQAKWVDMAKVTPLWQARYIGLQPADNEELFKSISPIPPWTSNFLIQFTGDGLGPQPHSMPGLENGADLDAFNGDSQALMQAWPGPAISAVIA